MIFPGLTARDHIKFLPTDAFNNTDVTCPLTCFPMSVFDTQEFLHEMLKASVEETDVQKRKRFKAKLEDMISQCNPCIQVARLEECGHVFQALPLVFHVMTSKFRCPVCRKGSNEEIDITCTEKVQRALPGFDSNLSEVLCEISRLNRDKKKLDEMREEMAELLELHVSENNRFEEMSTEELLQELRVSAIFTFLAETDVGFNSSSKNFQVSMNSRILVAVDGIQIKFQSGQALRPLSAVLRTCTSFSVTLMAETNGVCGSFFQSRPLSFPGNIDQVQRVQCVHGTHGDVDLRWDRDPISNIVLLRGISYTTVPENIRRISLTTMGASSNFV